MVGVLVEARLAPAWVTGRSLPPSFSSPKPLLREGIRAASCSLQLSFPVLLRDKCTEHTAHLWKVSHSEVLSVSQARAASTPVCFGTGSPPRTPPDQPSPPVPTPATTLCCQPLWTPRLSTESPARVVSLSSPPHRRQHGAQGAAAACPAGLGQAALGAGPQLCSRPPTPSSDAAQSPLTSEEPSS